MRVRPTELGWKGLLLLAALWLAFEATAYSNLFFLVVVFCCALGAAGLAAGVRNVLGVAVTRVEVPLAAAGEARPVHLDVALRSRRCDVVVELLLDGGAFAIADAALVVAAGTLPAVLPAQPRGVQQVRGVRVSTRFPFGFFRVSRTRPATATIVTHPAPTTAGARARHDRHDAGATRAFATHGTSLAGVRPFRAGDAVADVHWRATARTGTPVVKEREPEVERACTLVLDRRCAGEAFERALSAAAGAVVDARGAKATVRLLSQDTALETGREHGDGEAVLRWLAAATPLPPTAPPPPAAAGALLLPRRIGAER